MYVAQPSRLAIIRAKIESWATIMIDIGVLELYIKKAKI